MLQLMQLLGGVVVVNDWNSDPVKEWRPRILDRSTSALAPRRRQDLANFILMWLCLHISGCGGNTATVAALSQIDLTAQRSVSEFGISPDSSPFELWAFKTASNLELQLPSAKTVKLAVDSAMLRRDAKSDRVKSFQFNLPTMTAVQAALAAKKIVAEVTVLDSNVEAKIDTWLVAAAEMPPTHTRTLSPPSIPKLHLNGLGANPHSNISFYQSFDDAKPWFLAVQFRWDTE